MSSRGSWSGFSFHGVPLAAIGGEGRWDAGGSVFPHRLFFLRQEHGAPDSLTVSEFSSFWHSLSSPQRLFRLRPQLLPLVILLLLLSLVFNHLRMAKWVPWFQASRTRFLSEPAEVLTFAWIRLFLWGRSVP